MWQHQFRCGWRGPHAGGLCPHEQRVHSNVPTPANPCPRPQITYTSVYLEEAKRRSAFCMYYFFSKTNACLIFHSIHWWRQPLQWKADPRFFSCSHHITLLKFPVWAIITNSHRHASGLIHLSKERGAVRADILKHFPTKTGIFWIAHKADSLSFLVFAARLGFPSSVLWGGGALAY